MKMRKIKEQLTSSWKEADEFERKFWKEAGSETRFQALWLMVKEFYKMRGKSADKLRLQRSVQNIQQI